MGHDLDRGGYQQVYMFNEGLGKAYRYAALKVHAATSRSPILQARNGRAATTGYDIAVRHNRIHATETSKFIKSIRGEGGISHSV